MPTLFPKSAGVFARTGRKKVGKWSEVGWAVP